MSTLLRIKKIAGKTLTPEKFKKVVEKLFSEGFVNTNGAVTQLVDYIGYKAYLLIEEFENDEGHKVVLEFIKEFENGRIYYHIKEVVVE
jgi:hypothetical protein